MQANLSAVSQKMDNRVKDKGDKPDSRPLERLFTDLRADEILASEFAESNLFFGASSDRLTKKTRELPNFSDCQSCGLRINCTNPSERLQLLESMWRIVLLCKKCIKRVNSSDLCPYCFSVTMEADCFRCTGCRRSIHNVCVLKYGEFAPWSYVCSDSRFSVCVDCWIPKSLVRSLKVYSGNCWSKKKIVGSVVSVTENTKRKCLEEAAENAHLLLKKKIDGAKRTRDSALIKAVIAKNMLELANGALNLVTRKRKDETDKGNSCKDSNLKSKVVDDSELAFMLHRAMNSSPRILKTSDAGNQRCLTSSEMHESAEYPSNCELTEKFDRTFSQTLSSFATSGCNFSIDLNGRAVENVKYSSNSCKNDKIGGGRCSAEPDRYLLKYKRIHRNDRYLLKYRRIKRTYRHLLKYQRIIRTFGKPSSLVKVSPSGSCTDSVTLNEGPRINTKSCVDGNETLPIGGQRCDDIPDRFLLKYKRKLVSKPIFNHESCSLIDSSQLEREK